MNPDVIALELALEPVDNLRLANLSGELDHNLRQIEQRLGVEISHRGHHFHILGEKAASQTARWVLTQAYQVAHQVLLPPAIHLWIQEALANRNNPPDDSAPTVVPLLCQGKVRPRSLNQGHYLQRILHHSINFGVGPAGTGKTYLAMACAVEALEAQTVRRIILVRPAVEAGERLGFLPGDLAQKIDPYLRPLYDALYDLLGFERAERLQQQNIIEVAPLAYMRGRTLNDAFIILDEAQNTTVEQMKMFLTRMGFGSTMVVTGDISQVDLPRNQRSGLRHVLEVLNGVAGISVTLFNVGDVVRHPLVAAIVEAYQHYEPQDRPDRLE